MKTENNLIFEAYTNNQPNSKQFAINICIRRKDDFSIKKEKYTILEDLTNDFESNKYFEDTNISIEPYKNTLNNGSSMLELTLTTDSNHLTTTQIERVVKQMGALSRFNYTVIVYDLGE